MEPLLEVRMTKYMMDYVSPELNGLTHSGRDKMAAIFQTTFSKAFSWMKMCDFDSDFTEVCC